MSHLVAGLGSEYRRDDGVALAVVQRVAARAAPPVATIAPLHDPLELLGRWEAAELAVVVDATRSGAPPGTVRVLPLGDDATITGGAPTSTHGLGLAEVLALAHALGEPPRAVVVVGIEGLDFGRGVGLSAPVAAAVDEAVQVVLGVLGRAGA